MSKNVNVEIKARTNEPDGVRNRLLKMSPDFKGIDHQIDTYFNVSSGRLKLREGTIEHSLIHYQRSDQSGPKQSDVLLYHPEPDPALREILAASLGIKAIVDKKREIYFLDNVKFHIDDVKDLGTFVEIEAIDSTGKRDAKALLRQCQHYMEMLDINDNDLIDVSYSDMVQNLSASARGK